MAVAESVEQQAESFVRSPHKLLIDGEWVEAASGRTFETLNPATEEVLGEVAHGQAQDINRAVKAARRAFADDSPWRRMNASDRGRLIWRVAELIEENADELAMLESLDNGKPYHIAKAADVALSADLFRYMAGWPTKIEGTTVPISALPAPGEYLAYTLREPVMLHFSSIRKFPVREIRIAAPHKNQIPQQASILSELAGGFQSGAKLVRGTQRRQRQ